MAIMHSITNSDNGSTITIMFSDGETQIITDEHKDFADIRAKLQSIDPADTPEAVEAFVRGKLDTAQIITNKLIELDEQVTTDGRYVYIDGVVVKDAVAEWILNSIKRGDIDDLQPDHYTSLAKFLAKTRLNPSLESSDSLFRFLKKWDMVILPDGNILAYKGVNSELKSINSGFGVVDNVQMDGHLPNNPGSVITYPRADIDTDANHGCSVGLHAGSIEYATGFGSRYVAVSINPRDVVVIPNDSSYQKIRTCRYQVLNELPQSIVKETRKQSRLTQNDVFEEFGIDSDAFGTQTDEEFAFDDAADVVADNASNKTSGASGNEDTSQGATNGVAEEPIIVDDIIAGAGEIANDLFESVLDALAGDFEGLNIIKKARYARDTRVAKQNHPAQGDKNSETTTDEGNDYTWRG